MIDAPLADGITRVAPLTDCAVEFRQPSEPGSTPVVERLCSDNSEIETLPDSPTAA